MVNLTITDTEPTSLLKDFTTFIHYLINHEVVLTPTNQFISGKNLYELNQAMTSPVPDTTLRTDQTLYPLLHLFYHLALAGKVFRKASTKEHKIGLTPIVERLQAYEKLTLTEKYFFLLEIFWTDTDWQKLQVGLSGRAPLTQVAPILEFLGKRQPGEELQLKRNSDTTRLGLMFWDWGYFLLYFSFFGFWRLTRAKELPRGYIYKRNFQAGSLTPSLLGVTLSPIINESRPLAYWNLPRRRQEAGEWKAVPGTPLSKQDPYRFFEEELRSKTLGPGQAKLVGIKQDEPFFLPFVPLFATGELQTTLPRETIELVKGTYVFKVALSKKLWRRIELDASHTLLHLHQAIQKAYDFDDDHLYSFFMDGKPWSDERFNSPNDEEGPFVTEVRIGEIGLVIGQNILYLFDYGDEWRFQVELEAIHSEGPRLLKPRIVETQGKAPAQYGFEE